MPGEPNLPLRESSALRRPRASGSFRAAALCRPEVDRQPAPRPRPTWFHPWSFCVTGPDPFSHLKIDELHPSLCFIRIVVLWVV